MKKIFKSRMILQVMVASVVTVLAVTAIANAVTTLGTNISTGGTLSVTGASTLTGAVTAASTMAVTGNLNVNGMATTTASSGAIASEGGLTIAGATVLNGGLTMDSTAFTVANTTGNTSIGGTLAVTGVTTLTGNLNVNNMATTTAATGAFATQGLITANGGVTVASGQTLTVTGATITGLAASSAVNTPAGNIAAVNVQTALNELDTEKLALAGGTMTGDLAMGANSITMTGSLAATGARATKGWFTDVESTNMITVGGTSLSSTFQAADADLTTYAGITPSANVVTLLGAADFAAFKTSLSLGNVDNTSDANKPVSTAQQTALDLKANLAGPTFTGTVGTATTTASVALVIPSGTTPSASDACTSTAAGAIRVDTDGAAGSKIIFCDGTTWTAN